MTPLAPRRVEDRHLRQGGVRVSAITEARVGGVSWGWVGARVVGARVGARVIGLGTWSVCVLFGGSGT